MYKKYLQMLYETKRKKKKEREVTSRQAWRGNKMESLRSNVKTGIRFKGNKI